MRLPQLHVDKPKRQKVKSRPNKESLYRLTVLVFMCIVQKCACAGDRDCSHYGFSKLLPLRLARQCVEVGFVTHQLASLPPNYHSFLNRHDKYDYRSMSASNDDRCAKWLEICFKIKSVKEEMLVMFIIARNIK